MNNAEKLDAQAPKHPPIEHPIRLGSANKALLDTTATAYNAALELASEGFQVIEMHVTGRNPVLWVRNTGHCRRLEAFTKITSNGKHGRETIMAANFKGAQVQWLVRGY